MKLSNYTVVCPHYNDLENLKQTIDSLIQQSIPPNEIIIVDDLSNIDIRTSLVKMIGKSAENLRIIFSPNKLFPEGARLTGAQQSKNEYILFVDSDNVLENNCAELLLCRLMKEEAIVGPRMMYLENRNKIWFISNKFNYFTGRTKYVDIRKTYIQNRYTRVLESHHIPNVFMCEKSKFLNVNQETKYFIGFEESAAQLRLKQKYGVRILVVRDSICYHNSGLKDKFRQVVSDSVIRNQYLIVNRRKFIREFGKWYHVFFFELIGKYIMLILYVSVYLREKAYQSVLPAIKNTIVKI